MSEPTAKSTVDRDQVLATIRAHADELRAMKVRSVSLFGSVARGEAGPDSDIDLLLEVERPFTFFDLSDVKQRLEQILDHRVDLVTRAGLHDRLRSDVLREAIRAA